MSGDRLVSFVTGWIVNEKADRLSAAGPCVPSDALRPVLPGRPTEMGSHHFPFAVPVPKIFPYKDGFLVGPIVETHKRHDSLLHVPDAPGGQ